MAMGMINAGARVRFMGGAPVTYDVAEVSITGRLVRLRGYSTWFHADILKPVYRVKMGRFDGTLWEFVGAYHEHR
jgi:hypothetical protein